MNAKEKTYMMALAALLLIGLSTAWASYNATATISTSSNGEYATINVKQSSISLSGLKKNAWFYKNVGTVFFINDTAKDVWVRVGVLNMAELVDDFKALDINVTLELVSGTGSGTGDWDVISLGAGVSSVLLKASVTGDTTPDFAIKVYITGRPTSSSANIKLYCSVEPAAEVTPP
jgi:hypothetical protein